MPTDDHPRLAHTVGRSGMLLIALAVAVIGVSGHLPGDAEPIAHQPISHRVSVPLLIALAIVSVLIVGAAMLSFTRRQTAPHSALEPISERRRRHRPPRRELLLLTAGAILLTTATIVVANLLPTPLVEQTTTAATAMPMDPAPPDQARPPDPVAAPTPLDTNTLRILAIAAGVTVAAAITATVTIARRAARHRTTSPSPDIPAAALHSAIERAATRAITEIAATRSDPREVILACYGAMENELATIPRLSPTASDTASDVLFRAVDCGVVQPRTAIELVTLFAEARFSSHTMTQQHEDHAIELLHNILTVLKATART